MGVNSAIEICASVLLVANLLVTFGLVRRLRLGTGQERVADAAWQNGVGLRVSDFSATSTTGEVLTQSSVNEGRQTVAFFSASCDPCSHLKNRLLKMGAGKLDIAFVHGSDQQSAELTAFAQDLDRVAPRVAVVQGSSMDLADEGSPFAAFDVTSFPMLFEVTNGVTTRAGHGLSAISRPR